MKKIIYDNFWNLIKEKNISQYKLHHTYGIGMSTLTNLRNNQGVKTETICKLCNILDCDISDILMLVEEEYISNIQNKDDNKGYIYIIKVNEYYKIGISKNFDKRFGDYTRLMEIPEKIYHAFVFNYKKLESHLHELFQHKRTNGEWFKLTQEDLKIIEEYIDSFKVDR